MYTDGAGHLVVSGGGSILFQTQSNPYTFTKFISPAGSDSNSGNSVSSPWAITSLSSGSGNNSALAGKQVGLMQGVYPLNTAYESSTYLAPACHVPAGSSGTPTVIASCDNTGNYSRGAAQLTASPSGTPGGGLPSSSVSGNMIGQNSGAAGGYITLDGLNCSDGFGCIFCVWSGITNHTPGVIIQNCEFYNGNGDEGSNPGAIMLEGCLGALVTNCKIHDWQPDDLGQHNCAGIFSFSSNGNTYSYNTIYNCNSCIYDKDSSNGGHTYVYNYIECNGSAPNNCVTDSGGGVAGQLRTVHHNVFMGAAGVGILLGVNDSGPNYYDPAESLAFYNNSCWGLGGNWAGCWWGAQGTGVSPTAAVTHYNNIYACASTPNFIGTLLFNTATGAVALSNYNAYTGAAQSKLCVSAGTNSPSNTYTTLAAWQAARSIDANSFAQSSTSGIFTNPGVNLTPTGYQLHSGSPCLGAGYTNGTGSGGAACDQGAYGYDSSTGSNNTQVGCNF